MNLPTSMTVAGSSVTVSKQLKIVGVTIDNTLDFEDHVNGIIRTCNYHRRALCHNWHLLTHGIANMLARSITGSLIDNCNALLFKAVDKLICKLQHVQGNLARRLISAHAVYTTLDE